MNDVEIWDVSGNAAFESGWRAVMQHCDGVLLVKVEVVFRAL